jgi:hypothetical protein
MLSCAMRHSVCVKKWRIDAFFQWLIRCFVAIGTIAPLGANCACVFEARDKRIIQADHAERNVSFA